MNLARLFRRNTAAKDAATALYHSLVEKARDPAFYGRLSVPDTVDGRFDMIVIHVMLVLRAMRSSPASGDVSEALLALLFSDMDRSLREMGVGDMSIGKHVKKMAKAFYGRAEQYEAGLDGDPATLRQALLANLYRHGAPAEGVLGAMAAYLQRAAAHLAQQSAADLASGRVNFGIAVP